MNESTEKRPLPKSLLNTWGPPAAAGAVIFLLSSIPGDRLPGHPEPLNVAVHLLEYGILAILLCRASISSGLTRNRATTILVVTAFCLSYGFLDELHQLLTPYRVFDAYDLALDTAGALLSSTFYTTWGFGRVP